MANEKHTVMAKTDSLGFFIFKNLEFEGQQTAYWQVNNSKGIELNDASIYWMNFPPIPPKIESLNIGKEKIQELQLPSVFMSDGDSVDVYTKMLDEVSIKTKKQEIALFGVPIQHTESDVSFSINFDVPMLVSLDDMLKLLPTCNMKEPPKYILDGIDIDNAKTFVIPSQVKRIELLRGSKGRIYGSGCVYAIYTHGVDKYFKNATTTKTVTLQGYQPLQTFYTPNYSIKSSSEPDNRQTLYWNPALLINPDQSQIPIKFYASDVSGTYRVVVQGLSNQGFVYAETSFKVE